MRFLPVLHENMLGIYPKVIDHKLNISSKVKPVIQRKRSIAPGSLVIKEEVGKLIWLGFIREVNYPSWLANVVMVKKANGGCA